VRDLAFSSLTFLYIVGAVGMALYGLHALWLVTAFVRGRRAQPERAAGDPASAVRMVDDVAWPPVTVQLPVYNEREVVVRLLEAAAALDYPPEKLQIQLLDDSDDDTSLLADQCVAALQAAGVNVECVRRARRIGYKAGALSHALPQATGEFLVLFDADFLPPPAFLKQIIVPFLAPGGDRLAFVQGRWAHLNRDYSLLTRCQALALDGHFGVEQPARAENGLPFGFNGSAGAWRRSAIEDPAVGGWQADTLCEDLDLSYRALLAGWSGLFLPTVAAPAEVPPQLLAFKRQQARWATGSVQTLRKLGGPVARSGWSLRARVGGLFHLGNYLIHPLLLLLLLASVPLTLAGEAPPALLGALSLASLGPPILYAVAQRALHRDKWFRNWSVLPLLMLMGLGLAWSNSRAVWAGLTSRGGAFARTPKFRVVSAGDSWQRSTYRLPLTGQSVVEALLALYALAGAVGGWLQGNWWAALFLALFAAAFGAMVGVEFRQAWRQRGLRPASRTGARPGNRSEPRLEPRPSRRADERAEGHPLAEGSAHAQPKVGSAHSPLA
jgi:cellulose synthase/poly-beta-1,6-N-acetylglucosamine synthase-like glycosyltransferase